MRVDVDCVACPHCSGFLAWYCESLGGPSTKDTGYRCDTCFAYVALPFRGGPVLYHPEVARRRRSEEGGTP